MIALIQKKSSCIFFSLKGIKIDDFLNIFYIIYSFDILYQYYAQIYYINKYFQIQY
jgi:hypothetical protein